MLGKVLDLIRHPRKIPLVLNAKWNRMFKRPGKVDVWNLDCYLATVIRNSVIELKKDPHLGVPISMTEEEYIGDLDEIIEGFDQYVSYSHGKIEELDPEKWDKTMELFAKNFRSFWT